MTLTKEEKAELIESKCNARLRCKEVWSTIQQLEKMLSTYREIHDRWKRHFEYADRALAEEEKLTKVPGLGKGKKKELTDLQLLVKLDKTQLLRIAEALEVELEGGEERDE